MVSYEHHDVSPINNSMKELELKGMKLLVLVKAHIIKYKSTDSQAWPGKTFQIVLLFFSSSQLTWCFHLIVQS